MATQRQQIVKKSDLELKVWCILNSIEIGQTRFFFILYLALDINLALRHRLQVLVAVEFTRLQAEFGESGLFRSSVFEWCKAIKGGR